jgi:hypothetical protein
MLFDNNMITYAVKKYSCPWCTNSYTADKPLYVHVRLAHSDEIPEGMSAEQRVFNVKHNKEFQLCTICKINHTKWNPKTGRYSLICEDPVCKKTARDRFLANFKKKNGKDHSINDPEIQKQMLFAKKNSGEYAFKDGGKVRYASTYEKDFLELLDLTLNYPSDPATIRECDIYFNYIYEEKPKFYIPDYYMEQLDLIIEIKSDENSHPKIQAVDKVTEELKDNAVKKDGSHNFIKIMNKDYTQFLELIEVLKNKHINKSSYDKYCIIPDYKPPKNLDKMPELDFYKSKEKFNNDNIINLYNRISDKNDLLFSLVLNKSRIPEEYMNEEDKILINEEKIILRETKVDINNESKVRQTFNEFNKYVTNKYMKFIDQKFLNTVFKATNCSVIYTDKLIKVDKILGGFGKNIKEFVTIVTSTGYVLVLLTTHYELFDKVPKIYKDTKFNKNDILVPIPGTIDNGYIVKVNDEYSNVEKN